MPAELTYARLFAGPVGASHFGEGSIPFRLTKFAPLAPLAAMAATRCVFLDLPGSFDAGLTPPGLVIVGAQPPHSRCVGGLDVSSCW